MGILSNRQERIMASLWKLISALHLFLSWFLAVFAATDSRDLAALNALKSSWKNLPPNWAGGDPCGSEWDGVNCTGARVTSLTLAGVGVEGSGISDISSLTGLQLLDLSNNIGLKGTLPSSIGNLKNLTILILVGCSFFGPIPDSIGSLDQLVYISLNSNGFTGRIPSSLGNLSQLSWLDLSMNRLNGTIPVSDGNTPGLDNLHSARHFHFSNNQLSGSVPDELFSSKMSLIHVIFDNNQLTGNLPSSLGSVATLEVIRFDRNLLDGPIPGSLGNLTNLAELYLSNNKFSGSIPDLTNMIALQYVDMSNNSFDAAEAPEWFSSIQSLTTLMMANTALRGQIPVEIFRLPQLETLILSNNDLNGTLDIGDRYSSNLTVDLQNNGISDFRQKSNYNLAITLAGNPVCNSNGGKDKYCTIESRPNTFLPLNNCTETSCRKGKVLSPNCRCSNPYTGTLHFYSFSFSDLQNASYNNILYGAVMTAFRSNGIPVDTVLLSNPAIDSYSYLKFPLQIFPSTVDVFNRTSVSSMGFILNRQPFQIEYFGPFFFIDEPYCCFGGSKESSHVGIIIGAAIGGSFLVFLILLAGIYALRQKRKAKRAIEKSNPFASWDPAKESGAVPQLQGAKWLSFEDLRKSTNNFSESNCIGSGGYGKVYKGTVVPAQAVAIKRAQQGSMQGALEFKTEIELLSRIHHKNVVSLVGFCYEQGEQMLVYEYIQNGTLQDWLSGKSGSWLTWNKRLGIALDAARGLSYLHELADPPIIHRDIKSNNILLDNNLNAKVADFGLSKLLGDTGKGYVTTQVKGTLGYLDPEYYMTQQLTEKSDVYSFGVVLLELVTARAPIQKGKHIVKFVQEANFDQIVDPNLESASKLPGVVEFVDLAMSCVRESAGERPTMGEVVRKIENIMQSTNLDKKIDRPLSSYSFEETTDESPLHSQAAEVSYGSFPFPVHRQ
ncbi:leucine-rich repeat receptor protein kinase HPCA1-like isoform X2 [Andrographis paniculata]|uniref:leucine-rich repeat receptor protein kinase HPCA1-like isoform X2 n=1 Tax=Andrographis paniculata TaxID=175694 RepID=UPI0021E83760|nr:leucine-rich repeat receptor protein kinase HPCA1-like isoform X2 [Andrographis paniculata]XP_051146890.1 leucine-rich repeat receptor protein kinase HPCA1-like isoform X2 [Andrographis paniculata]